MHTTTTTTRPRAEARNPGGAGACWCGQESTPSVTATAHGADAGAPPSRIDVRQPPLTAQVPSRPRRTDESRSSWNRAA